MLATVIAAVWALIWSTPVSALAGTNEFLATLQSGFLYQFTKFIEWPQGFPAEGNDGAFCITLIGGGPLQESLKQLASQKKALGMEIHLHARSPAEPVDTRTKSCHMVVVSVREPEVAQRLLKELRDARGLVVSDGQGLAGKGSMISFFIEEEQLRFEVNRRALERARLRASSQLLKLAKLVD